MTKERFWVIGGEYHCVAHRELQEKPHVEGPFDSREAARTVWQRLSKEYSSLANARFSILTEQVTSPR